MKHYKHCSTPQDHAFPMLLYTFMECYRPLQVMIDNSRVNPLLYPNLGGLLIYSNKMLSHMSRDLRIPKVSIRNMLFDKSSVYTKAL